MPKPVANAPHIAYRPGLDGLRAIAVIAVFLYHSRIDWLPGGFLGVDLFFVLSGYLITSLLLVEWEARNRIDLRRFWLRRARRLLPALVVVVLGVARPRRDLRPPGPRPHPRRRGQLAPLLHELARDLREPLVLQPDGQPVAAAAHCGRSRWRSSSTSSGRCCSSRASSSSAASGCRCSSSPASPPRPR